MSTATTTAQAQETANPNPEFVDSHGLYSMFGIKRSLAYQLLGDGRIKGVSLRRRGQLKGKRLFLVDSVRNYLTQTMEEGTTEQQPEAIA